MSRSCVVEIAFDRGIPKASMARSGALELITAWHPRRAHGVGRAASTAPPAGGGLLHAAPGAAGAAKPAISRRFARAVSSNTSNGVRRAWFTSSRAALVDKVQEPGRGGVRLKQFPGESHVSP
jgi:hypothetical protein